MTLYETPLLYPLLRGIAWLGLKLAGWTIEGEAPREKKLVAVAAPHASNWDFPVFIALILVLRIPVRFLGKHTLFQGPFGWLFRWLGGTPVDRARPGGIITDAVAAFAAADQMILGIAPEGTRAHVTEWKSGFHRIARAAEVNVVIGFADYPGKRVGIGPTIQLTDDFDADLDRIFDIYEGLIGYRPLSKDTAA